MSKTVIVPGAAAGINTIVTDEDKDCRRGHGDRDDHRDDLDEVILREMLANQRVRERDNVESRAAICGVKTAALETENRLSVESAKNAAAGMLATEKVAAALGVQAEKLGAAGILQAEKLAAASTLQACKIAAESSIEAAKYHAALDVQAEKIGAANVLQQQVLASAAALAAATNTATVQALINSTSCDIKSQMAECCCEIKSSIRDDGDRTRDRMNHINDLALAVQLQDSKNEASELKTQLLIESRLNGGHHSRS